MYKNASEYFGDKGMSGCVTKMDFALVWVFALLWL